MSHLRRAVAGVSVMLALVTCDKATAPLFCADIQVLPEERSVRVGETLQLTGIALDNASNPLAGIAVEWESGTPALASVTRAGLVTGIRVGVAQLRATCLPKEPGTESKDVSVTVTPE